MLVGLSRADLNGQLATVTMLSTQKDPECAGVRLDATGEMVAIRRTDLRASPDEEHCALALLNGLYAAFSPDFQSETEMIIVERSPIDPGGWQDRSNLRDSIVLATMTAEELKGFQGTAQIAKMAKQASGQGVAGMLMVSPDDEISQLIGTGKEHSAIPVLMIRSSDAARLREHGSAVIRGASRLC